MKLQRYKDFKINEELSPSDIWMDEIDKFSINLAKLEKWVESVQTKQQHDVDNWGYSYALKFVNDTLEKVSKDLEKMDQGNVS